LRILALQVPAVESGVLSPPAAIAAGVWCKHLYGGLSVLVVAVPQVASAAVLPAVLLAVAAAAAPGAQW
jgi:hypothetical protein